MKIKQKVRHLTKNVRYLIDSRRRLIIFGRGGIPNYAPASKLGEEVPWKNEEITEVIIAGGVDYIGAYAFAHNSSIQRIIISRTVEDIHPKAFGKLKLSQIVIRGIFSDKSVLEVTDTGIYNNTTQELLIGSDIRHIKIREGTKLIGMDAFSDSQDLEIVECPDSLEIICVRAFENCRNLKEIYRIPDKIRIGRQAYQGTSGMICFYENNYPRNRVEDKKYICAITDYGSATLKDGMFRFYASNKEENIDPTDLYACRDLIDIKGGHDFIIGLRANGQVVIADLNTPAEPFEVYQRYGSIERLDNWENICQIEASDEFAVGRSADGTVFSTLAEDENEPLSGMTDIIGVTIRNNTIWGMKKNGECVLYVRHS